MKQEGLDSFVRQASFFFFYFGPFKLISTCNPETTKQKITFKQQISKECRKKWWKQKQGLVGPKHRQTDRRQRAKNVPRTERASYLRGSQLGDLRKRTQHSFPLQSPAKAMQSRDFLTQKKLATCPSATLRWGPIFTSWQGCQDGWNLPTVKEGEKAAQWLNPALQLLPSTSCSHHRALHHRLSCLGWDLNIQDSTSRLHGPLPTGWGSRTGEPGKS